MGDFRQLRAWQEAVRLVVQSRDAIAHLPPVERFALADQWRRAAYSVALNLAEGASRKGPREFRRYLDIARGSLHEIEAILTLVKALGRARSVVPSYRRNVVTSFLTPTRSSPAAWSSRRR